MIVLKTEGEKRFNFIQVSFSLGESGGWIWGQAKGDTANGGITPIVPYRGKRQIVIITPRIGECLICT